MATREQVMAALFARLQSIPGIASTSRRMTLPAAVAPGDQPRLMLWEQPEMAMGGSGTPDQRVWEAWIVIVFTNPDLDVAGSTIINPMLEAIEDALRIDDWGHYNCTLGGLVHYARIEGVIVKETGDTDSNGLGGAVVPIKIMPP